MKVWTVAEYSTPGEVFTFEHDTRVSSKYVDDKIYPLFHDQISKFFENKDFGEGVKEIMYFQRCLAKEHHHPITAIYTYSKTIKKIQCVVELHYESALEMEIPEFRNYVVERYLSETAKFSGYKIKDFDHEGYLKELELFFNNQKMKR